MPVAGRERDSLIAGVGRLDAEHALPFFGTEIRESRSLFCPGIPNDRGRRTCLRDVDLPLQSWIAQDASALCVDIDAVGFTGELQRSVRARFAFEVIYL